LASRIRKIPTTETFGATYCVVGLYAMPALPELVIRVLVALLVY